MVSVLVYSETKWDAAELESTAKELIARMSEDYWEIRRISMFEEMRGFLEKKPLLHLIIYDICEKEALPFLFRIREAYKQLRIMLLADTSVSPMEYITPGIGASSLLLRPWTKEQARNVLQDFLKEYIRLTNMINSDDSEYYVIETKEGVIAIPYDQIYFFEAREKKVYVCIGKEEYGFYAVIDRLADMLPGEFARCHRSFIVNTKKIRKITLSQNVIYLDDGFDVPLSRSYKAVIKGMVNDGANG